MKKSLPLFRAVLSALFFAVVLSYLFFGNVLIPLAVEAERVFFTTIFPAVLPYGAASAAFFYFSRRNGSESEKRAAGFSLFSGLLAGEPVGLQNALSFLNAGGNKKTALFLILFSSVPSPLLLIPCIGIFSYGSLLLGILFYGAALFVSILLTFLCLRKMPKGERATFTGVRRPVYDPVFPTAKSLLVSAGYMGLFYPYAVLSSRALSRLPFFSTRPLLIAFFTALIEPTAGSLLFGIIKTPLSAGLTVATLALGGLPFLFQAYPLLKNTKISPARFYLFKTAQATLLILLLSFLPPTLF